MSFEDIRDNYKNSRQSNDVKLKLNGATYRKVRSDFSHTKVGNLIKVNDRNEMKDLDDLNSKYQMVKSNLSYSLNKKKRWQIASELTKNMDEFGQDDIDVRLYETRNRNEKKSNCIAIHKSKGDKISVKKTYANLESIKKRQELDDIKKHQPLSAPAVVNQNKNTKSKNKKNIQVEDEHIVIDTRKPSDDSDDQYIQYEIEYAPTKDILKYGAKRLNNKNEFSKSSNRTFDFSEFLDYESSISELDEETSDENEDYNIANEPVYYNLNDLIDVYLKSTSEKQNLVEDKNTEEIIQDKKDRKIYIDNSKATQIHKTKVKNEFKINKNFSKPVPISVLINKESIDCNKLMSTYGITYSEAFCCWPRYFSINLNKRINSDLKEKYSINKNFDVICWLTFEQVVNLDKNEENFDEFRVSIVSNFKCKSISIENINPCEIFNIDDVVNKSIYFVLSLPLEYFEIKDFSKPWSALNKSNLVEELPNIGGKAPVKTLNEIQLEIIQNSCKKNSNLIRSNSIEVVKCLDNGLDQNEQNKIEQKLDLIFKSKKYECILCFDQKENLNDCILIKNCAHSVCNECMKAYIDLYLTNSFSRAGNLQCPGCENELELALIVNLGSNASLIDVYLKNTIEKIMLVLNKYKWCPSPSCSKIIQLDLNTNPFGTVSCECGFKMCLRCNNSPHFPAKCSQLANYYKELKSKNELADPVDENCLSIGKRCPHCNSFMEKNGGCNHMICSVCQKDFCWMCLSPWNGHTICQNKSTNKNVTIEFKREKKSFKNNKYSRYEDSLAHRKKRMPKERRILAKNAKNILETFNFYELSECDPKNKDEQTCKKIEEKKNEIKVFLSDIVNFVNEQHFVCEHAFVLLRDNSISKSDKNRILNIIRSIELNIWFIENRLEGNANGTKTIEDLKKYQKKGLQYLRILKDLNKDS